MLQQVKQSCTIYPIQLEWNNYANIR